MPNSNADARRILVNLLEHLGFLHPGVSFEEARQAFNRYVEEKYQLKSRVQP